VSKAKKTNKYEPIYTFETKVPLRKLLKSSALINFAPFLILFIFSINGYIDAKHALGLASSIFILSLLFIYPYIADLQDLTEYVRKLNRDNNSKRPELSFINNVEELSSEIEILNKKWQQKNLSLKKALMVKEKKNKFNIEISKTLPSIKGSPEDISRAVENLVSNAIRYNKEKSSILIKISKTSKLDEKLKPKTKSSSYVKISVKDNGDGIDKKLLPRLTERFYRVDKARSRKVGGSGLGLSIVNQIAKNHGGFLDVKSDLGKGSEFIIYLPS